MLHFPAMTSINSHNDHNKKRISTIEADVQSLQTTNKPLADVVTKNLQFNKEVTLMFNVIFKNQYGDTIPTEVPVREMQHSDYERLCWTEYTV